MADSVWAVVVTRVTNGAKSRLAAILDAGARRELALAMLADVVDACVASPLVAGTLAVVDAPVARWLVQRHGAIAIDDPGVGDMNAAARAGILAAERRGATTVLVLPGDIPLVSQADLRSIVDAAASWPRAVVIGASRDGVGTNALLLRPPDVMSPSFGPPSVERHVHLACAARAHVQVLRGLDLALDIDTPDDLARWSGQPLGELERPLAR